MQTLKLCGFLSEMSVSLIPALTTTQFLADNQLQCFDKLRQLYFFKDFIEPLSINQLVALSVTLPFVFAVWTFPVSVTPFKVIVAEAIFVAAEATVIAAFLKTRLYFDCEIQLLFVDQSKCF